MKQMDEQLKKYVEEMYDTFHEIPEKGMEEYKTSALVAEKLREFGYEVTDHVGGKTGVIGVWDTGKEGPVLGLRADMDALEYVIDGKKEMRHTCGHDAHTSMLLTAAKAIKEQDLVKKGKLVLIFQPAEEKFNGALSMIDSGLLNGITNLIGMHVRPVDDTCSGKATPDMWHSATMMMQCRIKGVNAHGARPHLGVNAVDVAAAVVNAINAIKEKPDVPHSIKVTNISVGGDTYNAIPDNAFMAIDIRSQNNEVMESMVKKTDRIFENITKAYGAEYELISRGGVPAAEYDADMIKFAEQSIKNVLGEDASIGTLYNPGGEDFHYMTQRLKCKSTYIGLGADAAPGLHHKDMHLNKGALIYGVEIWLDVVKRMLG